MSYTSNWDFGFLTSVGVFVSTSEPSLPVATSAGKAGKAGIARVAFYATQMQPVFQRNLTPIPPNYGWYTETQVFRNQYGTYRYGSRHIFNTRLLFHTDFAPTQGAFAKVRVAISGTTKDSTGAALGSCIVNLFGTEANDFQGSTTSNGSGAYSFASVTLGPHYLVSYKAGSPDVAGTTVNNVVGT